MDCSLPVTSNNVMMSRRKREDDLTIAAICNEYKHRGLVSIHCLTDRLAE